MFNFHGKLKRRELQNGGRWCPFEVLVSVSESLHHAGFSHPVNALVKVKVNSVTFDQKYKKV
jgi:hypothetical protein